MKKGIKISIIFIAFLFLFVSINFLEVNSLKINGSDLEISKDENYIDEGYTLKFLGIKLNKKVKTTSTVDTSTIGTYKVTYETKFLINKVKKERIVKVKDGIYPTIELIGKEEVTLCPNSEYVEEGFKAEDNLDGDITSNVETIIEDGKIIYKVADSSNNITTKERKIIKEDVKKPSITLKGSATTYVIKGNKYKDKGATATDNCDGTITKNIVTTNNVNTNKKGTYKVTYEVNDSSGNKATKERKVVVTNQISGYIYLTFDDGPSLDITPKILDILKKNDVKATFFITFGDTSTDYLLKRIHDEGHTLALHSYTHNYSKVYASESSYFNDLNKIRNRVYNATGVKSNIIRFPGGSSNTVSYFNPGIMSRLTRLVEQKGYTYFDWNVSSGDASSHPTKKSVYNNVTRHLGSGTNVVLMHDYSGNKATLNALQDVIDYGKEHGYVFERITSSTPVIQHGIAN